MTARIRRARRIPGKQWPDLTLEERTRVLEWIVDTCLLHGASLSTSYLVAAQFAHGMEPEATTRWPR